MKRILCAGLLLVSSGVILGGEPGGSFSFVNSYKTVKCPDCGRGFPFRSKFPHQGCSGGAQAGQEVDYQPVLGGAVFDTSENFDPNGEVDLQKSLSQAISDNDVDAVERSFKDGAKVNNSAVDALISLGQAYNAEDIVDVVLAIKGHRSCSINADRIRKAFPSMGLL